MTDEAIGDFKSPPATGSTVARPGRDRAGLSPGPQGFPPPGVSEMPWRGGSPSLGAHRGLSGRAGSPVKHPARTAAAGGALGAKLSEAASQAGGDL